MTANRVYQTTNDGVPAVAFECPGCGHLHSLPVEGPKAWGFNGNLESPTLTPSILARWEWGEEREQKVCHSFVTDGRIRFLNDCTHELAGQTVELEIIE